MVISCIIMVISCSIMVISCSFSAHVCFCSCFFYLFVFVFIWFFHALVWLQNKTRSFVCSQDLLNIEEIFDSDLNNSELVCIAHYSLSYIFESSHFTKIWRLIKIVILLKYPINTLL